MPTGAESLVESAIYEFQPHPTLRAVLTGKDCSVATCPTQMAAIERLCRNRPLFYYEPAQAGLNMQVASEAILRRALRNERAVSLKPFSTSQILQVYADQTVARPSEQLELGANARSVRIGRTLQLLSVLPLLFLFLRSSSKGSTDSLAEEEPATLTSIQGQTRSRIQVAERSCQRRVSEGG